jgi:hypothetical protein
MTNAKISGGKNVPLCFLKIALIEIFPIKIFLPIFACGKILLKMWGGNDAAPQNSARYFIFFRASCAGL